MNNKEIHSVVGDFFFGEINEQNIFPYPGFTPEQKEVAEGMVDAVKKFCEDKIHTAEFDEKEEIPKDVLSGLAELGLYGLAVPEEFGGLALDYCLYSRVFSEVCSFDGSTGVTLGAHQSIGYRALINEGTEEQKKEWLPKLASGEWVAAFCLTEPGSGSDAYSIKTKAVKNQDGSFTITGQKLWITNGGMAHFYSVFCKTDHEVDGKIVEKISCFAVTRDMPGITFGEKEKKMGIKASETRAVYFDKVVVPAKNVIGELGKGFKTSMNVLNSGRLSLGAGSVGGMRSVIKLATAHAKNRRQFDRPIAEFGLIQEKLVRMNSLCYATECMVYLTSGNMVRGMKDYYLESAICKVFGSEALWSVVDMGMQIAAGTGYMKDYPYEQIMRDSRINLIFEGTNEILRIFVALSGMKGPSDKLKDLGKISDVSKALEDPIKSLGVLTDFAKSRISKLIGTKSLTLCHADLQEQAIFFSSMLSDFAIDVENTLIKYGKNIIGNQLPQGRIANMAIELYLYIAVLSRTSYILNNEKISAEKKKHALMLAKHSLKESRQRFKSSQRAMTSNQDKLTKELSASICEQDGYCFDIIEY